MAANTSKSAVLLLSGGLDSATVLAIARADGFAVHALSVDYGQKQEVELVAATRVAEAQGAASHTVVHIDSRLFAGSALTDPIEVPKDRSPEAMGDGIPVTYVPARNLVFLSQALAFAESLGCYDLFCGVNAVDYSGYPDCRPEFIEAFERVANLATRSGTENAQTIRVHAPLIQLSKADIIRRGTALGVNYSITHSCYDPQNGLACGRCDACSLRKQGFLDAGYPDPTVYA